MFNKARYIDWVEEDFKLIDDDPAEDWWGYESWIEVIQAKIIYLFMNANGICTKEECSKLCNYAEVCVDSADKELIEEYVQSIGLVDNNDNSAAIIAAIDELLGLTARKENEQKSFWLSAVRVLNNNETLQALTLWELIKLAYYDKDYSKSEQAIIEFLIEEWNIDRNLYCAMINTIKTNFILSDTELALSDMRTWLRSINKNSMEISTVLARIPSSLGNLEIETNKVDVIEENRKNAEKAIASRIKYILDTPFFAQNRNLTDSFADIPRSVVELLEKFGDK